MSVLRSSRPGAIASSASSPWSGIRQQFAQLIRLSEGTCGRHDEPTSCQRKRRRGDPHCVWLLRENRCVMALHALLQLTQRFHEGDLSDAREIQGALDQLSAIESQLLGDPPDEDLWTLWDLALSADEVWQKGEVRARLERLLYAVAVESLYGHLPLEHKIRWLMDWRVMVEMGSHQWWNDLLQDVEKASSSFASLPFPPRSSDRDVEDRRVRYAVFVGLLLLIVLNFLGFWLHSGSRIKLGNTPATRVKLDFPVPTVAPSPASWQPVNPSLSPSPPPPPPASWQPVQPPSPPPPATWQTVNPSPPRATWQPASPPPPPPAPISWQPSTNRPLSPTTPQQPSSSSSSEPKPRFRLSSDGLCVRALTREPEEVQRLRVLGAGGFGVVDMVRIQDRQLGDGKPLVAARKTIKLSRAHEAEEFFSEVAALERVSDLEVFAAYLSPDGLTGTLFFEYVPEQDLTMLSGRGTFPDAVRLFTQLLLSVDRAHRQGVVHRDIKPANVRVSLNRETELPQFRLVDWGLSCGWRPLIGRQGQRGVSCRSNEVWGTPRHISPWYRRMAGYTIDQNRQGLAQLDEQFSCTSRTEAEPPMVSRVMVRNDLWGAASTVYEFLTGREIGDSRLVFEELHRTLAQQKDRLPASSPQRRQLEEVAQPLIGLLVRSLDPSDTCITPPKALMELSAAASPVSRLVEQERETFDSTSRILHC